MGCVFRCRFKYKAYTEINWNTKLPEAKVCQFQVSTTCSTPGGANKEREQKWHQTSGNNTHNLLHKLHIRLIKISPCLTVLIVKVPSLSALKGSLISTSYRLLWEHCSVCEMTRIISSLFWLHQRQTVIVSVTLQQKYLGGLEAIWAVREGQALLFG